MPIVGAAFLWAVSRAFARIDIEHDNPRQTPLVHRVDPSARQTGKSGEVFEPRQPFGLERPIWLAEAARSMGALPPTTQRMAGSWHNRSASFTSS